jgi:hypothetical protein
MDLVNLNLPSEFLFCRFMIKLFIINAKVPIWLCFLKPCVGLCVTYLYRIEADGRRGALFTIFWQFFLENFDSSFLGILSVLNGSFGQFLNQKAQSKIKPRELRGKKLFGKIKQLCLKFNFQNFTKKNWLTY